MTVAASGSPFFRMIKNCFAITSGLRKLSSTLAARKQQPAATIYFLHPINFCYIAVMRFIWLYTIEAMEENTRCINDIRFCTQLMTLTTKQIKGYKSKFLHRLLKKLQPVILSSFSFWSEIPSREEGELVILSIDNNSNRDINNLRINPNYKKQWYYTQ